MTSKFSVLRPALLALAGSAYALITSCGPGGAGVGIPEPTQRMARITGAEYDTIAAGYTLFRQNCTKCHSDRVPQAPPLGNKWHDDSLGVSLYTSFSDAERYALVEYLRSVDKHVLFP